MNLESLKARRWLLLLLTAGLLIRVYAAWAYRHQPATDYGRVALMAQHMAEGRHFPVFFYGSSYMGSFEPAVSALCCLLLGPTGLAVTLGTALLAFGLLPLLYCWAKEIAGEAAGLAALAYGLIGPYHYFYYMASPRGGYAAALLAGGVVLWMTGRLACGEWKRQPASTGAYLLTGFVAGIGWWSNQIVASALLTCAIALAVAMRGRIARGRIALAVAAFFFGSAPLWWWNAAHQWNTFSFLRSFGGTGAIQGIRIFFMERLPSLMDWRGASLWVAVPIAALTVLSLGVFAVRLIRERKRLSDPAQWHRWVLALYTVLFLLMFIRSHFAKVQTARYLLPLVPVLAIWMGLLAAECRKRGGAAWAVVLAGIVALWPAPHLWSARRSAERSEPRWKEAGALADVAEQRGVQVVYADIWKHWINFASGERVTVCNLMGEPFAPYEKQAEQADSIGLLNGFGHIDDFLAAGGGVCRVTNVGPWMLQYDFQPPADRGRPVPAEQVTAMGPAKATLDGNLYTAWSVDAVDRRAFSLHYTFKEPVTLSGVDLISLDGRHPPRFRVEVRQANTPDWQPVKEGVLQPFFWSGERWYYRGLHERCAIRFTAREQTEAVRLTFHTQHPPTHYDCSELIFLEPTGAGDFDVAKLAAYCRTAAVRRVYADRWVSREVRRLTDGAVASPTPGFMDREVNDPPDLLLPEYPNIDWWMPDRALIVETGWADRTRHLLERSDLPANEDEVGAWTVFRPDVEPGEQVFAGLESAGRFFMQLPPDRRRERHAHLRFHQIFRRDRKASPQYMKAVLNIDPTYEPALDHLRTLYRRADDEEGLKALQDWRKRHLQPTGPAQARFMKGLEWVGADVPTNAVKAGDEMPLTYWWRCSRKVRTKDWAVFVHFKRDGKVLFQDDHVLMEDVRPMDIREQGYERIYRVRRRVRIPSSAPTGEYEMHVGVYRRSTGKRVRPRTGGAAVEDRAAVLPCRVRVVRP